MNPDMDAARRISDEYNMHRMIGSENYGGWLAFRIADGTSDHTLYPNRQRAVQSCKGNEKFFCFMQVGPWQCSAQDALAFLSAQRKLYDTGLRMADPDARQGGRDIIPRANTVRN